MTTTAVVTPIPAEPAHAAAPGDPAASSVDAAFGLVLAEAATTLDKTSASECFGAAGRAGIDLPTTETADGAPSGSPPGAAAPPLTPAPVRPAPESVAAELVAAEAGEALVPPPADVEPLPAGEVGYTAAPPAASTPAFTAAALAAPTTAPATAPIISPTAALTAKAPGTSEDKGARLPAGALPNAVGLERGAQEITTSIVPPDPAIASIVPPTAGAPAAELQSERMPAARSATAASAPLLPAESASPAERGGSIAPAPPHAGAGAGTEPADAATTSGGPSAVAPAAATAAAAPPVSSAEQLPAPAPAEIPRERTTLAALADATRTIIRVAARDGHARALLTLRPAELGQVEIRLRYHDGRLSADVVAESRQAADVLLQAAGELRRSLESQGITLHSLDVRDGSAHRGTRDHHSHDPGRGGALARDEPGGGDQSTTIEASSLPLPEGALDVLA